MFQKLLERIIMSYFGDFLNGIDPTNLHIGIWNGNISIENVSLNEQKINHLMLSSKLPFELKYSHIGGLKVIVPWNKLSSMPVQITITDVYLFLKMKETDSKVELKDIILNKKELVKNYCDYLTTKLLGDKKQEKQQGYLKKMITKIIDNIQLKIENIHVRVHGGQQVEEVFYSLEQEEDPTVMIDEESSKSFAFGFCIKSIQAYTTDQTWNRKFIDRSEKKQLDMRKKLFFNEISVYWQEKDVVPISSLRPEDIKHLMSEIIVRTNKRLLSISGEVKFVEVRDPTKPQYTLTTKFDVLQLQMNFQQLRGIICLGEKVSEYKSFQKAANLHLILQEEQLKLQNQFKKYVSNQYQTKFQKLPQQFQKILVSVNKQLLLKWTKQSITEIIKRKKIETKEKEKNQKKWWNFLSTEEVKISKEEEEQIGKLMNDMISEQEVSRDSNSQWISLNVQIVKGTIGVLHSEINQLFYLQYENMIVNLNLLKSKKHFSLILVLETSSLKYIKHQKQFKSVQQILKQKIQICEIEILKHLDREKSLLQLFISKQQTLVDVKLTSQKIQINYQTRIILLIKQLMKVKNSEHLNSLAWNTMTHKLQQKANQMQKKEEQEKKTEDKVQYRINMQVGGVFVVVLLQQTEHLVIYFNRMWISNVDASNKKGCVQQFSIKMVNKTKADIQKMRYSQKIGSQQVFLVHPLSPVLSLQVTKLKNVIDLQTGKINISINKTHIIKLKSFIQKQLQIGDQQKKQSYREGLQQNCQKSGYVKILNTFKTWKKYYAILTDSYIQFFEEDQYNPMVKWFIKNCILNELGQSKLKLESGSLSEVIQFKDDHELKQWKSKIQQVVISTAQGQQLYEMFQDLQVKNKPAVNLQLKETIINFNISQIDLLFQQDKPVLHFNVQQIRAMLIQSKYFFNRTFTISKFELADLRQSTDSEYYSIIKSNTYSRINQFNKQVNSKLQIKVNGKKKFHPNYKSQLFIKGVLGGVTINFNPRVILHFVRLLGKKKTKHQFSNKSQRQQAIFGYTRNFLESNFFQQVQQSISTSKPIQNKQTFTKFNQFQKSQKVLVMLDVDFVIESVRMNLIHRTTKCCNNTITSNNLSIRLRNGNNFMFVEIGLQNARIFDLSNYPNTINNFQNEGQMTPYEIVGPTTTDSSVKVWFSTFQNYIFTNQQRTTSFLLLILNNYTIRYQQQPMMRFIDYLNNQLISFILKPFSVDIYEYNYNKEFKFSDYQQFTTKQVQKIIQGLLLPFFSSLTVHCNNLIVHFNSHPHLESLLLNINKVTVESKDLFTNNRISINEAKKKECRQIKNFKQLENNLIFEQRILNGCWVQQQIITLSGVTIGDKTEPFNLVIDFQRLPNCQRSLMFPFIQQDKTLMLSGVIDNLQLRLTKELYNLLLKCMIHNLTHDDYKDCLYQHNFKFQHLMEASPMSNLIRIKEGNIFMVDIQTKLNIGNLQYWFVRDAKMNKKMMVNIQRLKLFNRQQQIVAKHWKENNNEQEYDLQYQFTSDKNFDKKMSVKCKSLRIFAFNIQIFKKVAAFVLVPQECFPNTGELGDLPMITCNVELNNCVIAYAMFQKFGFIASGEIIYIWNRNRSRNYELVRQERIKGIKTVDIGVTTSHIIYLKNVELMKVNHQELMLGKTLSREGVRKLSTPINVFLRINDILKFSSNHIIYYDKSMYYSIQSAGIIMSYQDISEIMAYFSSPVQAPQEVPQNPPVQSFNPNQPSSSTEHNLIIYNFQFQILASSPQAPLMSISIVDGKLKCTQLRNMMPVHSSFKIGIHYYNLKVGVWQPVLEQVELSLQMKWGEQKYLRAQCQDSLLIDVSVQFIKLLKLLLADISNVNASKSNRNSVGSLVRKTTIQNMIEENKHMHINNTSPYIIKNNLGCQLMIQSQQGNQHYVLEPCDAIHYRTQNQSVTSMQPKIIKLVINDGRSIHEIPDIDLDKIKNKLMRIQFAGRIVDIKFIAYYRQIIKEIVISSCYLIKNNTLFDLELQANDKVLKILKGEESALPYTLFFDQCTFNLNFPHLTDVKQNYAFSSECLLPHYQHYILTKNQMFNCNVQPEQDLNTQVMKIVVSPVFVFRNSLPCNITIQLSWTTNGVQNHLEDELNVQQEKGYHQIGSKDSINIKVKLPGFQFSQVSSLYNPMNRQYSLDSVQFSDFRGNLGRINIKCSIKNRVKKYTFWTSGFIVNQTNYDLFFFNGGSFIPGQKFHNIKQTESVVCLIGDLKSINFSLGDDNSDRSQNPISPALSLVELGSNQFSVVNGNRLIQFATYTGAHCVDSKQQLLSTIIQITPRYIVVNRCSAPILVKHHLSDRFKYVDVQAKQPLQFDIRFKTKHICMKLQSQHKKWKYSEPINFNQNSSIISFALRSQEMGENSKAHIRLQVTKQLQYQYLIFSQVIREQDYLISIQNCLQFTRIEMYQKVIDQKIPSWQLNKALKLKQNGGIEQYSFDYPNQSKQMKVVFQFVGPLRADFDDCQTVIDLSLQAFTTQIQQLSSVRDKKIDIFVSVQSIAGKKTVKFTERKEINDNQQMDEFIHMNIALSFKEIGISMIGESKGRRCEILYMNMKDCELMLLQKSTIRAIQLKIRYINIDNNSNHNTSNAVILTPQKQQKAMKSTRPFLLFLIQQNLKFKKTNEIKSMRICIQPTSIKLDDEFLQIVFNLIKQINNSSVETEQVKLLSMINPAEFSWNNRDISSLTSQTFVQQFEIAKISLRISFSMRPKGSSSNMLLYRILESFGVLFMKISDSPITFSRLLLLARNTNQIKKQITSVYFKQFTRGIWNILFSINIIGNPSKFIRFIGQGFLDLIDYPVQGFIKGPIEGAFGIVGGSLGLVKNVVAGSFNCLQSVSESVSSAMSSLSFDQKFVERRQKIKNYQTKNFLSGSLYGIYSLYGGIQLAISGLYRQPVDGYHSNGFIGGCAGTFKALAGLFIKPISGAFEGLSKTSQGIKNTALLFQDGPKTQRCRPPRIFYGQQFIYKSYNQQQAQAIGVLQHLSTRYLNLVILDIISFDNQESQQGNELLISSSFICLFNRKNKKIYWQQQVGKISFVKPSRDQEGVVIITKQKQQLFIQTKKPDELVQKVMAAVQANVKPDQQDD